MSAVSVVKHVDPTQVELEIAIPQEELEAARERAFRRLVQRAKVPGFRPGKAPRKIFEAQYGTQAIEEQAIEDVVPRLYSEVLRENDLDPVAQPQMELRPKDEADADGEMLLKATVAVRPQIALGNYKGLEVTSPPQTVSDEDFERNLTYLRRQYATLVPVDRPVERGDVPTLDYEGKVDGVPFAGGAAKNQPTEMDDQRFIADLIAGIVGMKAGETKDVPVTFPEKYHSAALAGKAAVFTVTVHENKVAELPALDDDFAKRFSPEATLESLKADLRSRFDEDVKRQAREAMKGTLLEQLLASHEVPLPQVLVDREIDAVRSEAKTNVARAGLNWDAYLAESGKTEEALTEEYTEEAQRRVKLTLLIEAIAKAEGIQATAEDVQAEVAAFAQQYGQPESAVLEFLRPNMGAVIGGIVRGKTVEFLLDQASITPTP